MKLFIILTFVLPCSVYASVECYENTFHSAEIFECLTQQDQKIQKENETVIKKIVASVKFSPLKVKLIQNYHSTWIQARKFKCQFALASTDGGEQTGFAELECRMSENKTHQTELNQIHDSVKKNLHFFELFPVK